jgi:hypothetical protein
MGNEGELEVQHHHQTNINPVKVRFHIIDSNIGVNWRIRSAGSRSHGLVLLIFSSGLCIDISPLNPRSAYQDLKAEELSQPRSIKFRKV